MELSINGYEELVQGFMHDADPGSAKVVEGQYGTQYLPEE